MHLLPGYSLHHGAPCLHCNARLPVPLPSHPCRAAAVLLVSKRWHRVFLSEPALWRQFSLSHAPPSGSRASELALLRRVSGLVASLRLPQLVPEELSEALAAAQPGRLQGLALNASSWQLVAAVPRSYCLNKLESELGKPAGFGAALPQLPYLRSLGMSTAGATLRHADLSGVLAATQLTELSLSVGSFEQPEALRQLTHLSRLVRLHLAAVRSAARLDPQHPAHLPALTSFLFQSEAVDPSDASGVQVGPPCLRIAHALPADASSA